MLRAGTSVWWGSQRGPPRASKCGGFCLLYLLLVSLLLCLLVFIFLYFLLCCFCSHFFPQFVCLHVLLSHPIYVLLDPFPIPLRPPLPLFFVLHFPSLFRPPFPSHCVPPFLQSCSSLLPLVFISPLHVSLLIPPPPPFLFVILPHSTPPSFLRPSTVFPFLLIRPLTPTHTIRMTFNSSFYTLVTFATQCCIGTFTYVGLVIMFCFFIFLDRVGFYFCFIYFCILSYILSSRSHWSKTLITVYFITLITLINILNFTNTRSNRRWRSQTYTQKPLKTNWFPLAFSRLFSCFRFFFLRLAVTVDKSMWGSRAWGFPWCIYRLAGRRRHARSIP